LTGNIWSVLYGDKKKIKPVSDGSRDRLRVRVSFPRACDFRGANSGSVKILRVRRIFQNRTGKVGWPRDGRRKKRKTYLESL